mgnify:CR=1 FL=1
MDDLFLALNGLRISEALGADIDDLENFDPEAFVTAMLE